MKSGKDFGLSLHYEIQEAAGGIAQGISLAESFSDGERLLVVLGDNIFGHNLKNTVESFKKKEKGAIVFAIKMPTESRQYGVIEVGKDN